MIDKGEFSGAFGKCGREVFALARLKIGIENHDFSASFGGNSPGCAGVIASSAANDLGVGGAIDKNLEAMLARDLVLRGGFISSGKYVGREIVGSGGIDSVCGGDVNAC